MAKDETEFIRFTETYTVKAPEGETYEEGRSYEVTPDRAEHFVSRGRAVRITAAEHKGAKPKDDGGSAEDDGEPKTESKKKSK
ncbi:MAG: hypothetical protein AB7G12_12755 [Thermoanaerobaculia bacterium]